MLMASRYMLPTQDKSSPASIVEKKGIFKQNVKIINDFPQLVQQSNDRAIF